MEYSEKQSARGGFSLSRRLSLWISARSKRAARFTLSQRNIYIFPSAAGFGFLALLLLMLVTAINYQSSLVYMLTFLLGAVFFISIWLCFLNLRGLCIEAGEVQGGFKQEGVCYQIKLLQPVQASYALRLAAHPESHKELDLAPGSVTTIELDAGVAGRGRYTPDRVLIESYYPFGFIRAWTWLKLDVHCLVYPDPIAPPPQATGSGSDSTTTSRIKGGDKDLLRGFQVGDNLARVHWKKFASSEQLVVRDHAFVAPNRHWLKWDDYPEADTETRLGYLCFQILQRSESGEEFGLELPGHRVHVRGGASHCRECLDRLADFGFGQEAARQVPFDGLSSGASKPR